MKILSRTEIKKSYRHWSAIDSIDAAQARSRGYEFERILYSLLLNENLEPSASYKPKGEQIDGSFFYSGQTFLLEAKWHKDQLPVSSIYSFKGKVDGKFHTTSGVFISIGGYSEDVSDALRFGKSINILLFDKKDVDAIILSDISFEEVLKFKIRQAGDTGNAYVNYGIRKIVRDISESSPVVSGSMGSDITHKGSDSGVDLGLPEHPMFLVICEGRTDEEHLRRLFENLDFVTPVAFQFKVLNGVNNLLKNVPVLVNTLAQLQEKKYDLKGVIVILDEDSQAKKFIENFNMIIRENLKNNAISTELFVLFFNSNRIADVNSKKLDKIKDREIRALKDFINSKVDVEIYLEEEEGEEEIRRILKSIEWDIYENQAYYPGLEKHSGRSFLSLEELISFLEGEAEGAAANNVPWDSEYLETYHPPDFSQIVYECLQDYKTEIESLGWAVE